MRKIKSSLIEVALTALTVVVFLFPIGSDALAYVNCQLPSDIGKECAAPSNRYCAEDGFFIKMDRHFCVYGVEPALVCKTISYTVGSCTGITEQHCSSDKNSVETVTYGCNPNTVTCTAILSREIIQVCLPQKTECQPDDILRTTYAQACVEVPNSSPPSAHCASLKPPFKDNRCNPPIGECLTILKGKNTVFTCPIGGVACVQKDSNIACSDGKRVCSSDGKSYEVKPKEKCVLETIPPIDQPPIRAGGSKVKCELVTPGSNGTCAGTTVECGGNGFYNFYNTYSYICNDNPNPLTINCIKGPPVTTPCNPEIKSCSEDGGSLITTPKEVCSDNNGGGPGLCSADPNPPPPQNCAVDSQYQCAGEPPLLGQQLIGFCNNSTNPNKCDDAWQPLGSPFPCSNEEVPWPTGEKRCSGSGVEEKWGNIQCIGVGDGTAQPTCGVSNPHWKLVQSCSLLCTAWDTCDGTNVLKTRHCNGCKDLACTSWTEPVSTFDCAPPSEDTANYCSGGVQCTLTAKYSGKCIDPLKNGSAGCESPTVTVVCSGPCGGDGGGGGPCSPSGSTQACSGGGSQTCGGDGVWGDCECTAGSSLPHSECDKDGKCSNVNTCGVSDCSTCGCMPPKASPYSTCVEGKCETSNGCDISDCSNCGGCLFPNTTPHNECVNNVCASVNFCGTSDCSNCGGCPAGETNPHTACVNQQCANSDTCGVSNCEDCGGCPAGETNPHNVCDKKSGQCINSNTCGVSNCDNCGGPVIAKCDTNPLSPMFKQCTTAGAGKICSDDTACDIKYCDNSSKQCVFGGDSGIDCATNSDCATPPLPRCRANTQTCIATGKGMLCATNTDCKSTYCDYRSQKCIFGGNSKISCEGISDCQSPPVGKCDVNPESSTYQQCSESGAGILCNNNLDCEFQPTRCNGSRQCVPDDCGGIQCDTGIDCQNQLIPTQCNACKQCVPGGGGADCSNDSDCSQQKFTCTGSRQCLPDDCGTILCSDGSQCESQPLQCNACKQCVPGGGGGDCSSDDECSLLPIECNEQKQCVPGGGGAPCPDDPSLWQSFCQDQAFKCNTDRQCVPDDIGGDSCDPNLDGSDCQSQPLQCNGYKQCVPGGGGADCDPDFDGSNCKGEPPTAMNLQALRIQCIGILGTGGVSFQWDYSDVENNPESHFWLEIDDNSNFSSPVVSREVSNPGSPQNQQLVLAKLTPAADSISFNKTYYWHVKVQENADGVFQDSGWVDGEQYVLSGHPDPVPSFIFFPRPSAPGASVNFQNLSTCYNNSGDSVACDNYNWNFGDNSPPSTEKDISHTYAVKGSYPATLTVYDDSGAGCLTGQTIPVTDTGANELPRWKEISPFR